MLKRPNRLRTVRAFRRLRKRGKTAGSRFLFMRYVPTDDPASTRFAVIVAKKTEKTAVGRNRVRRQVTEILRHLLPEIKGGYDVSITLKQRFLELSFAEKRKAVIRVLQRAGLLD